MHRYIESPFELGCILGECAGIPSESDMDDEEPDDPPTTLAVQPNVSSIAVGPATRQATPADPNPLPEIHEDDDVDCAVRPITSNFPYRTFADHF